MWAAAAAALLPTHLSPLPLAPNSQGGVIFKIVHTQPSHRQRAQSRRRCSSGDGGVEAVAAPSVCRRVVVVEEFKAFGGID